MSSQDTNAGMSPDGQGGGGHLASSKELVDAGNVNANPNNNPYASPLTLEQLDPGIPITKVQTAAAYKVAMAYDLESQAQTHQFIQENGAAVVHGHSPVGMSSESGRDPNPFTEASTNQTTKPAVFDPVDSVIPVPGTTGS